MTRPEQMTILGSNEFYLSLKSKVWNSVAGITAAPQLTLSNELETAGRPSSISLKQTSPIKATASGKVTIQAPKVKKKKPIPTL